MCQIFFEHPEKAIKSQCPCSRVGIIWAFIEQETTQVPPQSENIMTKDPPLKLIKLFQWFSNDSILLQQALLLQRRGQYCLWTCLTTLVKRRRDTLLQKSGEECEDKETFLGKIVRRLFYFDLCAVQIKYFFSWTQIKMFSLISFKVGERSWKVWHFLTSIRLLEAW